MTVFAAVDIGASGGRVMRGVVEDERIDLEPVHRFANGIVELDGHLRWPLTSLFEEVGRGLAMIPDAESVGIDTWGVDYGLLDRHGRLVAEPIAYRDSRSLPAVQAVHERISPEELYAITGIQHLPFNTIFQLAVEPALDGARHVVLLPDLLAYWLTGSLGSELTNASTTGLLDARAGTWSATVLDLLGLDGDLLPTLQHAGTVRGRTEGGTPVVTVGSHDTASAVAGVPATTDRFAFVASGTWSLVGLELPQPILTEDARRANFTNEAGVDGTTRFLRNVGGLWLLQECMRDWGCDDLAGLLAGAAQLPAGGPQIDVDDDAFIPPGDMPARVAAAAGSTLSTVATARCILDSLAAAYARTVGQAAALSGRDVEVVHVVGGGSQNELLCQLTADAVGLPVIAGPVEATALGNVVVQAAAAGLLPPTLAAVRARLAQELDLRRYEPS